MGKDQPSTKEISKSADAPLIESTESKPNQPEQISLGEFLANSKESSVRKASNYIYVGFRKHCQLNNFPYRKTSVEWLKEFQQFINKAGN